MEQKHLKMYETYRIGTLELPNRLIRSAMFEFGADNGRITPEIKTLYRALAEGGSGLIITGMQAVSAGAGIGPAMVQATHEQYIDDMRQIADVIHQNGSCLFAQLNHAGYRTAWRLGYDSFGVSDYSISDTFSYHAATQAEIAQLIEDFGKAAIRAKTAGCDGVQIHAAHGFLINTFLSPYFNHRSDAYGGSIEKRARLLFDVYDAVRSSVGNDFPVSVKLPYCDMVSPSITPDECIWICTELEKRGIDMIEITSGTTMDGTTTSFTPIIEAGAPEGNFLGGASRIAEAVSVPVASVCGYRSSDFIEEVLQRTKLAAISLGRPLVREPDLPNRWKAGRGRAACISCNRCYKSKGIISCQVCTH